MMIEHLLNRLAVGPLPVCTLALVLSCQLQAHEGHSERIERLDQQIATTSEDPQLYFQRAEIHRICGHWQLAEKDYQRASQLDPELAVIVLAKATMWNDASKADKALPLLADYQEKMPSDPQGFREQARAFVLMGDLSEAAKAFARTAGLSESINPELIAAWADCLRAAERPEEALKVVQSGIEKIGPAVSLEKRALKLELDLGHHESALVRIDGMLARSARKETLLLEKSRILADAGRTQEALDLVKRAASELNKQPEDRRHSGHGRQLAAEIKTLETKLIQDLTSEDS